jgi:hypothetical protein
MSICGSRSDENSPSMGSRGRPSEPCAPPGLRRWMRPWPASSIPGGSVQSAKRPCHSRIHMGCVLRATRADAGKVPERHGAPLDPAAPPLVRERLLGKGREKGAKWIPGVCEIAWCFGQRGRDKIITISDISIASSGGVPELGAENTPRPDAGPGIVNLMNHSLTGLHRIAVMTFLHTRYWRISYLVTLTLTMPCLPPRSIR